MQLILSTFILVDNLHYFLFIDRWYFPSIFVLFISQKVKGYRVVPSFKFHLFKIVYSHFFNSLLIGVDIISHTIASWFLITFKCSNAILLLKLTNLSDVSIASFIKQFFSLCYQEVSKASLFFWWIFSSAKIGPLRLLRNQFEISQSALCLVEWQWANPAFMQIEEVTAELGAWLRGGFIMFCAVSQPHFNYNCFVNVHHPSITILDISWITLCLLVKIVWCFLNSNRYFVYIFIIFLYPWVAMLSSFSSNAHFLKVIWLIWGYLIFCQILVSVLPVGQSMEITWPL